LGVKVPAKLWNHSSAGAGSGAEKDPAALFISAAPSGVLRSGEGGVTTVITNLLARKEKLLEQLGTTEDANQRSDIQRKLEQVDTALEFLGAPERMSE
jgi:hypothetical protein